MNRTIGILSAFAIGIVGLLAFVAPTASRKLMADKSQSVMTYTMHHPMHTWDGVSREVQSVLLYNDATDRIEAVAVAVKLASFDSQNANRDSHALEILDGIKYPRVTFSSTGIEQTQDKLKIWGNLTFHGVTRPVEVLAVRVDKAGQLLATGEFSIKMSDYNIERPSLMMVPTDESFLVKFSMAYHKTAPVNQ
ncbi:YceI family protein [Larkinella humicola]|uniref:YceI family protein n=1 Tax=Larkinella humicola TaxID=2607654 RepID=A0A5N1JIY9_9BACT|nr:YceI family protein [Larkinella humicola]KAA9356405.1 YceI family protein [Larkinella humicola]